MNLITISKTRLRADMHRILRAIEQSGKEILVTDNNRPVLRIQPIRNALNKVTVEDAFADVHGKVEYHEDADAPSTSEWSLT